MNFPSFCKDLGFCRFSFDAAYSTKAKNIHNWLVQLDLAFLSPKCIDGPHLKRLSRLGLFINVFKFAFAIS